MEISTIDGDVGEHAAGSSTRETRDIPTRNEDAKTDILLNIQENMGQVAALLSTLCKNMPPALLNDERPLGESSSQAGSSQDHVSENDDEAEVDDRPPKRRRRADELSLHPSDDEEDLELLTGTATAHNDPPDGNEHEFLSELADMLEKNESSETPVTKQLADITDKRWGKHLPPEKIKLLMGRYETPENCSELLPVRVNPEIWDQLNATRRKTDLQLSNIQQTARKVAIAILQIVNHLLPQTKDEENKKLASRFVDSIAMLGHLSSDLSRLGREQIRPALKREFATICTKEIPNGPLLFGSDLPKQLKEAKEADTIGNSIAVPPRKRFGNYRTKPFEYRKANYSSNQNSRNPRGRKDFLSKGHSSNNKKRKRLPLASETRS